MYDRYKSVLFSNKKEMNEIGYRSDDVHMPEGDIHFVCIVEPTKICFVLNFVNPSEI